MSCDQLNGTNQPRVLHKNPGAPSFALLRRVGCIPFAPTFHIVNGEVRNPLLYRIHPEPHFQTIEMSPKNHPTHHNLSTFFHPKNSTFRPPAPEKYTRTTQPITRKTKDPPQLTTNPGKTRRVALSTAEWSVHRLLTFTSPGNPFLPHQRRVPPIRPR